VLQFRLQVEPSPHDPAVSGCLVTVVALGEGAVSPELVQGSAVEIVGSLTERRWRELGTPYAAVAGQATANAVVGVVAFQLVELLPGAVERRRAGKSRLRR
jgi:hypothetical protein